MSQYLQGEYHYYYEKLSDDDKLYLQADLCDDAKAHGSVISLNTTDTDNVSRIQQFVLLDNPQFST